MVKKLVLAVSMVMLGASLAYAAGGEINAKITQDSAISNSKVIGAPEVSAKVGDLPLVGGIEVSIDARTKINEIENSGKLGGTIAQTSDIQDTTIIGSQMNTIDNDGTISEESSISQKNTMTDGSIIVGTSVNRIVNGN